MWDDMKLKPVTVAEVSDTATPEGMRRRLNQYSRSNPMVRAIFDSAHYRGLSGEDKMTWLAYEALLAKEKYEDLLLEHTMLFPSQPVIFTNEVSHK